MDYLFLKTLMQSLLEKRAIYEQVLRTQKDIEVLQANEKVTHDLNILGPLFEGLHNEMLTQIEESTGKELKYLRMDVKDEPDLSKYMNRQKIIK